MTVLAGHDAAYVHAVWVFASIGGAVVIALLAVVYRRAAKRHALEEAERIIAEDA